MEKGFKGKRSSDVTESERYSEQVFLNGMCMSVGWLGDFVHEGEYLWVWVWVVWVFFWGGGKVLQNRMFVKDYLFSKGGENNDEDIV